MNHCWKDKSEYMAETFGEYSPKHIDAMVDDGTCMLLEGHAGVHVFTPDDKLLITVLDAGIEVESK